MIATITYLELKSPFKFFALSRKALDIVNQVKKTNAIAYKSTGFWTKHYTMTLWQNHQEMREFAMSGAHKESMKHSAKIAKEIRTYTFETESLPSWSKAKSLIMAEGKVLNF